MSFRSRRSDVAIPQAVIASEQSERGNPNPVKFTNLYLY